MQRIRFRTASPFLFQDVTPDTISHGETVIEAELYLPKAHHRAASVPAVVVSQGLSGASRSREHRYARLLSERGIATLVFDSFEARARGRSADPLKALAVSEAMLLADAFAALSFLSGRRDVRTDDIALLGFSYGGMISVLAAYRQIADLFMPNGPRFSRHIAHYGCSIPRLDDPRTTGAPVTLLVGGKDRNLDIDRTRLIADDLRSGGSQVDLTVYPDLYHQWDDADAGSKFVLLQLARAKVRVSRDNEVVCERTGITSRGWWSRSLIMALSSSPTGYHIRPNAAATAVSDAALLAALGRPEGAAVAPQPSAAPTVLQHNALYGSARPVPAAPA